MRFGPVPVGEAEGAVAAHGLRAGDLVLRKGQRIAAEDVERLRAAGAAEVVAVRLDPGDVPEDEAASRLALAAAGPGIRVDRPFTGRANLFAEVSGVLQVDRAGVDRANLVDEALTLATLPALKPVVPGEMVGTVKVIPYAVPGEVLGRALAAAPAPLLQVRPYALARVAVVSTLLPGLKAGVVDKTLRVLADRLAPTGAGISADLRVAHEAEAIAAELGRVEADLVVVFGASAIADRRDVIPAALEVAGGRVEHFGMPVDPGNLLLVGTLRGMPVIGAPGCARSPKENGFDWVLHRLLARIPVTRADIMGLGVGGLLMEIVSRPQPRAGRDGGGEGG